MSRRGDFFRHGFRVTANDGAKSSPGTLLATAKQLEFDTPLPEDLHRDFGEFAEFFHKASPHLDPAPASTALLLEDSAGSGDIEAAVDTFLDACFSDVVCKIAVQEFLVPDPVPSMGMYS